MKGDFSRNTFDPAKHFSRVLMQQGRVQLDADWNEQAAILLHYLCTLAEDLIGPRGGPAKNLGFGIAFQESDEPLDDLTIGEGRYYVDGILCENENPVTYYAQPHYFPDKEDDELPDVPFLVYLDVWERHVSYLEDEDEQGDEPGIREVALGGPDTATRAQVVWQVKTWEDVGTCPTDDEWKTLVDKWQPPRRGQLKARAQRDEESATDPCTASPDARYDRPENQLYRVEIHKPGAVGRAGAAGEATFKWSRENGSVVFPVEQVDTSSNPEPTTTVTLEHLGRDETLSLAPGDWVEIVNDTYVLHNCADPLLKVLAVNRKELKVTLKGTATVRTGPQEHTLLRRWDHKGKEGMSEGVPLKESQTTDSGWLKLEHGIEIQFQPPGAGEEATQYRTGDYWLIPARTETEDVEWPGPKGNPRAVPPHGIEHHYAPLWIITADGITTPDTHASNDCRRTFDPAG